MPLAIVCFGLFSISCFSTGQELDLDLSREGNKITVDFDVPEEFVEIEWIIDSGRNAHIEMMGERSDRAPESFPDRPFPDGFSIWFPVVDVQLGAGYEAMVVFENVGQDDELWFNGNFLDHHVMLEDEVRLTDGIEHWENQLFLISEEARPVAFSLIKKENLSSEQRRANFQVNPLIRDWYGSIRVRAKDASGEWIQIGSVELKRESNEKEPMRGQAVLSRELVMDSLRSTSQYLLASRNENPASPTFGGLYLFWDSDADTFRRSDWIWSYGPAIKFLLEASEVNDVSKVLGYESMRSAARGVAEASLRFQIEDEEHPASGLVLCRLDPRFDSPRGAEGFSSPADSLFLAGWGWIPYFEATGDRRFLDATRTMSQAVGRILDRDELVEQDFLLREGRWKNWTMDESGFGMVGFSSLYSITGDAQTVAIGQRYIAGLLKHLERSDGLWDRTLHRNDPNRTDNGWRVSAERGTPVLIKTKFSTRGLGWAMIGLLNAHKLLPESDFYLKKAITLSDHLLEGQTADGHWNFLFRDEQYPNEISVKGTALWSLLFYQLYAETGDQRHLDAARKSLDWCINNRIQFEGLSFGGIPEMNRESGVIYRRWSRLVCSYTMSWFGLALLEELKLQDAD